jgi:hypothetical protein
MMTKLVISFLGSPDLDLGLENTVSGHSNSPKMERFDWLIQMSQFKNLASASASAFSN